MDPRIRSIDSVIMLNAHEESRLPELLADYMQVHPEIAAAEARERLKARLCELIKAAKVGMYELPLRDAVKPYRELSVPEALAVVAEKEQWHWERPANCDAFFPLFPIDEQYWGE